MARDLTKKLEQAGWELSKTRRGHIKAVPPNGGRVFYLAGTPGDRLRGDKNTLMAIRREGHPV